MYGYNAPSQSEATMELTHNEVEKIGHLARLALSTDEITKYHTQLSNIFTFVAQMNQVDVKEVAPMAHPFNTTQPLRADAVTEKNERILLQSMAPAVEAGLYLVPKVIE
jgi:aspartyl-tRNA(Asn)/glutamyl-tRNA(Gln) amidotransferase subunit C